MSSCTRVASRCLASIPVLLAFATIYLVWGSTYLAIAVAVDSIPPFGAMAMRMLLAGSALLAFARWRGESRLTASEWRESALTGSMMFVGGYGVIAWAEQSVASGVAALLATTSPFWLVMLQWRNGERPTRLTWAGLLLGTAGVALLLNGGVASTRADVLRMTGILIGSFFWSLGTLRAARRATGGSAARMAGSEMFAGGWVLLALAVLLGEGRAFDAAAITLDSVLALGYLALFGSVIAFTAYRWLLGRVPAALVSTHAYVNPFIALLVGWWFAGEAIGASVIGSSIAIVGAVALLRMGTSRARSSRIQATSRDAVPATPQGTSATAASQEDMPAALTARTRTSSPTAARTAA